MIKNLIYFVIGLIVLVLITIEAVGKLTKHSLVDGNKPVFAYPKSMDEADGLVVNDLMSGQTSVL